MYKRLWANYVNSRAKLPRQPEKIWIYISRQKLKLRAENGGIRKVHLMRKMSPAGKAQWLSIDL